MNKKNIIISLILKFWTLFIGIGALIGAIMMWVDPSGKMWGLDWGLALLQQKMPFPDILFRNFIPSGFVLLTVNGITQYVAAYLLFKNSRLAPYFTLACGIILMSWIALEWYVWGFAFLSNIYFCFGLLEAATSIFAMKTMAAMKVNEENVAIKGKAIKGKLRSH